MYIVQLMKQMSICKGDLTYSNIYNINWWLWNGFLKVLPFNMENDCEVIVDLLRFLHEPPPTDIQTYAELGEYFYNKIIRRLGFNRRASCVTIVVDEAEFFPPPWEVVHHETGAHLDNNWLTRDDGHNTYQPEMKFDKQGYFRRGLMGGSQPGPPLFLAKYVFLSTLQ